MPTEAQVAAEQARKNYREKMQRQIAAQLRDIDDIPPITNMRRRVSARMNLKLFAETYFAELIYYDWSLDQLQLLKDLQRVILHGSNKAIALPRGGGKSTLCLISVIWAIAYGHRRYVYLIRDTQSNADDTLSSVRKIWEGNGLLYEDFPEIAYPIRMLEGNALKAKAQTYKGERTYVEWKSGEVHFPYLYGYHYLETDKGVASAILRTCGITGGIRGSNYLVPYVNEIIRPDLVLLDDVQTDAVAGSPTSIERYIDLIDGSIKGLSGPGQTIAAIMPCTVITPNDVSDTYLDRSNKPAWSGTRGRMVIQWPPGITDTEITDDTPAGKLWNKYSQKRLESLTQYGDIRDATAFYGEHRDEMDEGFSTSWEERYIKTGNNKELSSNQHAMNLRLDNIFTFLAEYQNHPSSIKHTDLVIIPPPGEFAERITNLEKFEAPFYAKYCVAHIDVQDEMLWYCVVALDQHYSGQIIDYGMFPEFGTGIRQSSGNMTRRNASKRKNLSHAYWVAHPDIIRDFSLRRDRIKAAPFEVRLTWGIDHLINMLLSEHRYTLEDGTPLNIDYLGIDIKWGASADLIKRYVAERRDPRIVPYEGMFVGASSRQFSEWARNKPGRIFEDQFHRGSKACRWIVTPETGTGVKKMYADVNAWKTFLMHRIAAPKGAPGAITLHKAHPVEHDLISQHVCRSEFAVPTTARGRTVFEWKVIPSGGWPDNDLLDCLTACMALASLKGCRVPTDMTQGQGSGDLITNVRGAMETTGDRPVASPKARKIRRKMSDLAAAKRKARETSRMR